MAGKVAPYGIDASRISRAEAVARELEQQIVGDGLPAGHRIGTKEDLRQRFGVAVATVNEGIRILETRGLVEARPGPGGGVFVVPASRVRLNHLILRFKVSDAPFSDCLAVRNALEPLVCREAAKRCTAKDARALTKIADRMEQLVESPSEFLRINWELHRRIAQLCRNVPLQTLYLTLLDFVEDGLQDVRTDEFFDMRDNLAAHRALVDGIIAGEGEQLDAAITAHMPIADRWRENGVG